MPDDMSEVHIACIQGVAEKVKTALESNGSSLLGTVDDFGTTAIHYATLEPNLLRMIAQYAGKMLFNIADGKGNTPLHHSIKYECTESVTILIGAPGCDVNLPNLKGETPLIAACKYSNSAIVQLLVASKRCDLNISDKKGNSALHVTVSNMSIDQLENVQCLLQSDKCDPNVINKSGCTPLHIVCHRGHVPLLEALVADKRCDPNIQDGNGDTALHIAVENVEVVKCLSESGRTRCDIYNEMGVTPFHKAIAKGALPSVEVMLQNGVNILQTSNDKFQNAPIHIACIYSRLDILKVLLGYTNCDPNQQNAVGDTALHIVCRMRKLQFLEVLTSQCDPNTALHIAVRSHLSGQLGKVQFLLLSDGFDPNKSGHNPLHIACHQGDIPLLEALLTDKRCVLNIQNDNGDTALHVGVENVEVMKCLLRGCPSSCDIYNKRGLTPFHKAIANGVMPSVQLMLKNGANILQTTNDKFENAPIHIACIHSRLDILKVLLGCINCDPNQQNAVGDTALHIVCGMRTGRTGSVLHFLEMLISRCDPNICDSEGNTALHIAVSRYSSGQSENVQCLLQSKRCDPNVINNSGCTPLHIACRQGFIHSLEELVAHKRCDLNIQDGNGDTALHIGVENVEVVKCLSESGRSRCDIYNEEGLTPFHKAIANGNMSSVEIMLKNGAYILQTSNDEVKNAPIHIACIHSRLDILKVLLESKKCDPNQQNANGDAALHIACRMRTGIEPELLKVLTSTPGINLMLVNHGGDAPIHTACMSSRLQSLKVLLSCKNCDPNQRNIKKDTALHIVCRVRTGDKLQIFELLTSTPGINSTLRNTESIAPCDVLGDDGNTLLHIACAVGTSTIVELLVKNRADILKPDRHGDAPIHIACEYSRLDILNVLLGCTNCNPNQQNTKGNTALHIVCRMRTGSMLQFLQMLTSAPGINPTLVNHEGIAPFDIVGDDGNTLLHNACDVGNITMVELLVKNGADVLKPDRYGNAPIHIACMKSRLQILKVLLSCESCDPNQQNTRGDTAFHIVCKVISEQTNSDNDVAISMVSTEFIEALLCVPGINHGIANHEGRTPIEVEGLNYSTITTIKKFLIHMRSSIQAYLKIFVVGNSGSGKSTLIKAVTTEASQLLKYTPLSKMKYVNPSDIPPLTAGIVPTPFSSKHFGNAVLYDFAGQHEYYSSHAAVMENLILPSPPLFLLLINISKSKEEIREELVYWWHFINNHSQKAAAPPHVILAGSHEDMVKSGDKEEVEIMIRDMIKGLPVTFEFVGNFPLDCRKLVSQGLSALLVQLGATCQTLRRIVDVNLHCHILKSLLRAPEFQGLVYCKLVDITNKIESDDAPLPKALPQLIPLLASLSDQGYILLLQNHTDKSKSWVILKPDVLLTNVNGSIFAPYYFKEHTEFAMSTGVVTLSKLEEKFTEYNVEVIVEYLIHLEFCFRIKDQHTLDMITKNAIHKSKNTEEYYFFPSLVRVENPADVCQSHKSIAYECGWLYKCSKETEQLTTRLLHVLILRLAFACKPPDTLTEKESVVLLRKCSVWKHGVAWWTNDGIEVIFEVGLQCHWIAVMLRCPTGKMVECAELRSKVIHTVLKAKTDFCPAITMREYLIAPSSLKYPFEGRELTLYSMTEVAAAVIEGKEYGRDTEGKNPITIPQLLPFEPYHNMGDLVPKFFSGNTSVAVTPEELTQVAEKCHDKLAELKTAFKPDISSFQRECVKADCIEVERCVALFHILQRRGRFKTWRDFQQEFSRFSIFCKQSPLEHTQKEKDRTLGDEPNSPIQLPSQYLPHTSTDIASAEGTTKEKVAESENESYAQLIPVDTTHMSAYEAVTENAGLTPTMIDLENEVIPTVCPLWREVGRQLHLKTSILDEIDEDCRGRVRRCCTRMFEEWLKEDTAASWYAVLIACKKVKENLASGPYEPRTKESIESLKQLINTLPAFFATL